MLGWSLQQTSVAAPGEGDQVDAQPKAVSVMGRVLLPQEIPDGVNMEGVQLSDAVLLLEGKYKHPKRPYPNRWSEMTREERREWFTVFEKSEAHDDYKRKVQAAMAERPVYRAAISEDGSFVFKNVQPAWYQFSAAIMHPKVKESSFEHARGYKMHQFFVREDGQPHQMGDLTLEFKNVLWPGDSAPEILAQTFEGEEFKLSDYRGSYVLFDFWATWCLPCIREIPNLEVLSREFGGEDFVVIGLNVDEDRGQAQAFLKEKELSYQQGYVGPEERYQKIRVDYGIRSIPSLWLIDPDGVIIARDLFEEGVVDSVRTALQGRVEKKEAAEGREQD